MSEHALARRAACGALMLASLGLAALAYRLADHRARPVVALTRGDLAFYPPFALAVATFMTAWIAGWMWDGVLGDKWRSLRFVWLLFLGGFLLFGLGPIAAASALGEDDGWVNGWRTYPVMAIMAWQTIKAVRDGSHEPR